MGGRISVQRVGQDRYGRTLAQVYVGGRNVACEQLGRGQAVYVEKWVVEVCSQPIADEPLSLPREGSSR